MFKLKLRIVFTLIIISFIPNLILLSQQTIYTPEGNPLVGIVYTEMSQPQIDYFNGKAIEIILFYSLNAEKKVKHLEYTTVLIMHGIYQKA